MAPQNTLMTANAFTAAYGNIHAELVKGVVKEYPPIWPKQGFICMTIAYFLQAHVKEHDLGRVASNDTWIQTSHNPDTVLGADVCFFSYERLPRGKMPDGLLTVMPDLVIEVRSPSDKWTRMFIKVGEYLAAGVRAVVILDQITTSASVYRVDEFQQIFHNGDPLTVPDVLPGFSVEISRLFP